MEKKFENPEIRIIKINTTDIIITSAGDIEDGPGDAPSRLVLDLEGEE